MSKPETKPEETSPMLSLLASLSSLSPVLPLSREGELEEEEVDSPPDPK